MNQYLQQRLEEQKQHIDIEFQHTQQQINQASGANEGSKWGALERYRYINIVDGNPKRLRGVRDQAPQSSDGRQLKVYSFMKTVENDCIESDLAKETYSECKPQFGEQGFGFCATEQSDRSM